MLQALLGAAAAIGEGVAAVGGALARGAAVVGEGAARGVAAAGEGIAKGASSVARGAAEGAESTTGSISKNLGRGLKNSFSSGQGNSNNSPQTTQVTVNEAPAPTNPGPQDLAQNIAQHSTSALSSRQGF